MTRTRPSRGAAALLAFLLAAFVAAGVAPAASAVETAASNSAFEAIGGCFAARKQVLVALVMDESASLGDAATDRPGTDPDARRVTAAQVAVDGIANLAAQGTRVEVLLTGFAERLTTYGGWRRLAPSTRGAIGRELEGFRTRNSGIDTDFYNAMDGVRLALARRTADLAAGDPCRLVLLFTDGRFDIDSDVPKPYASADLSKSAKADLGVAALCSPGGPMQQLRDDGARTLTLALSDPAAGAGKADPAFLRRLATGDCAMPSPQYGAAFDATDAAGLVGQFDAIATRLRGGTPVGSDCRTAQRIAVPAAISGIHVFADGGDPAADLMVTPPRGDAIRLDPSDDDRIRIAGADVRVTTTSDRFVTFDATADGDTDSDRWAGTWTFAMDPAGGRARCQVSVFETWRPQPREVTLQRGIAAEVRIDLVGPDGDRVPGDVLPAGATVGATVADSSPAAEPRPVPVRRDDDHWIATVDLPGTFPGQTAVLAATLRLPLAGTVVTSSPGVASLTVRQSGFPALSPDRLRLSTVSGTGSARGTLTIDGDAAYPGQVCVLRVTFAGATPIAADELRPGTRAGTCVPVAADGRARLGISVDVGAEGNGRVNGQLVLRVTGVNGRTLDTSVPFAFSVLPPVDAGARNLLFVVLLLAGIAAPLLLLLALARRDAAFVHPPGLRAARLRVRVYADGGLRRLTSSGEAPPLDFAEHDFVDAGLEPGRAHRFNWAELGFRAVWSWNPFAEPYGVVTAAGRFVTASEGTVAGAGPETDGRVPLTLPGTWIFELDPGDIVEGDRRAVDGTVTVFIAAGAPFAEQAPRVMRSFTGFFAELAAAIHRRHLAAEPTTVSPAR
ncbi:MAG: hypothetical protein ACKOOG_08420 [Actinomycetota bacterium]